MVVARGRDPARNVRAALDRLGGIGRFVTRTDRVLVKPNVGWDRTPAQAANTHPAVVAEVVRACRAAGAKEIWVCDCPVHDPERCFRRSGIREAAERAGARVLLPADTTTLDVRLSAELGVFPVPAPFARATKIINVPIAKDHGSARITAGMKNWIGITQHERGRFHQSLDESIASLALLMRPTLTVVDATRVLVRNGPQGGNLGDVRQKDRVAISVDPVALDAWVADLLGARLSEVEYLRIAAKKGLGRLDYRKLGLAEIATG
jgi:uncharacterized protein (DUF362 family)